MATITQLKVDEAFIECECNECGRIVVFMRVREDFEKCNEMAKARGNRGGVIFYSRLLSHVDEVLGFLVDCHRVEIAAKMGLLAEYLRDDDMGLLAEYLRDDDQPDDGEIPF